MLKTAIGKTCILLLTILSLTGIIAAAESLPDGLYAELKTRRGTILASLEYERVPLTVANFVGLAEGTIAFQGRTSGRPFYDGLSFHRVIADFMIQGGDPQGSGSGGPGYRFADELDPELKHDGPGVLSMANSGPNSNGSQFFITHKATPWLDGFHAVFGKVIEGQQVVDAIRQGDTIEKLEILRIGAKARAFRVDQKLFDKLVAEAPTRQKEYAARARKLALEQIERQWPNAQLTDSGLRFVVEKRGSGGSPGFGTAVTVHYWGALLNGLVFDSSHKRGQPATFEIGRVIQGWNDALVTMKRGGKRTLIIPPELAYGERGYPGLIPPGAFLVFELQLLDF